jgi:hypothetical protein
MLCQPRPIESTCQDAHTTEKALCGASQIDEIEFLVNVNTFAKDVAESSKMQLNCSNELPLIPS